LYTALCSVRSDFNSNIQLESKATYEIFFVAYISIVIHLIVFLWYRRLNNAEDFLSPSKRRQQIGIFFLVGVGLLCGGDNRSSRCVTYKITWICTAARPRKLEKENKKRKTKTKTTRRVAEN